MFEQASSDESESGSDDATRPTGRVRRLGVLGRIDELTLHALLLALVSRIVLFLAVWLGMRTIPLLPLYSDQTPDLLIPDSPLLNGWARWDAVHYASIAERGYPNGSGIAFFPVFPLLERFAVALVGGEPTLRNFAIAGIVISNLCFLIAAPLLAHLAARRFGREAGRSAALILCLIPFGFFFSAAYTESLFLLLAVAALMLSQTGQWRIASLFAGVASGTRLFGLALLPALLIDAKQRGAPLKTLIWIALTAPLGTLAFFGYSAWALDDALAPIHAQEGWGGWDVRLLGYVRVLVRDPAEMVWGNPSNLSIMINLAAASLAALSVLWAWRKVDTATLLWSAAIASQIVITWISLGRYVLPTISVYLMIGFLITRPGWRGWRRDAVILTFAMLQCVLAILFSHGFWIV